MENAVNGDCTQRDLIVNLKQRTPRFKAGSDLSTHVNLVDIDWNSDVVGEHEVLELKLHLRTQNCVEKDCKGGQNPK